MKVELPKWPVLLVKGDRITPEQADKVIIRTSIFHCLYSNDRKWNAEVKKVLGFHQKESLCRTPYDTWEEFERRVGTLDLQYLLNDRIATSNALGPYGWCAWDGTIGAEGMYLAGKWPEVEDIEGELRTIAFTFPFLRLTAQLARVEWDYDIPEISGHTPLVTWSVARGAVEMWDEPGPLLREVPGELSTEEEIKHYNRPGADIGVTPKRLAEAVRRCERETQKGK